VQPAGRGIVTLSSQVSTAKCAELLAPWASSKAAAGGFRSVPKGRGSEARMIETRIVEANGLAFTTDFAGPEEGAPVLMLHGFPQSRRAWRSQLEALAVAGYRGIAPDQRGYSPGARPAEAERYAANEIVDDALAIMDSLGAERFHLAGHDWGGQI